MTCDCCGCSIGELRGKVFRRIEWEDSYSEEDGYIAFWFNIPLEDGSETTSMIFEKI